MSERATSEALAPQARAAERPSALSTALLSLAATLVAAWPYTGVIRPGLWTTAVVLLVLTVVIVGLVVRLATRRWGAGIRTALTLLFQLLAATAMATALLAEQTALYGFIPTPATLRLLDVRFAAAAQEIVEGAAPLPATLPLATLIAPAFAVVAIIVDHLVAERLALLTIALTTVIGALPMIISFGGVNVAWFLAQAVMTLVLLRAAARGDRHNAREASVVVAGAVGVGAVAGAMVLAPGLPLADPIGGVGPVLTVDASLALGDDLRRPNDVEVLTIATEETEAPYLRIATLSRFNGEVWRPDRGPQRLVRDGFGPFDWTDEIDAEEQTTSIRVLGMSSGLLPVPYAASQVDGLGGGWSAMLENRTVTSNTDDSVGVDYTVTSSTPVPTLEQIRAADAAPSAVVVDPDLPQVIADTAAEVTADAATDYDRLIALQDWFRTEFSYSLEAPVEEGFDGTGADAVVQFLEARTGYCVHFAGAFALMAQTMDMQVRIVVGYLPGTATDERRGDERIFSVTSDQLHSWPEVFFPGIGWVPFEPTATLGVPTAFAADTTGGGAGEGPDAPTATTSPSATPSSAPTTGAEDDTGNAPGADALRTLDPTPIGVVLLGILAAVLLPGLIRFARSRVRTLRARDGDAMAAWHEMLDTLVDLGLPAPVAQSPRALAAHLVATRGVDADAIGVLADAVEQRSYARTPQSAGDLSEPLRSVTAALRASVDGRARFTARMLPRSLVMPQKARRPLAS